MSLHVHLKQYSKLQQLERTISEIEYCYNLCIENDNLEDAKELAKRRWKVAREFLRLEYQLYFKI